MSHPENRYPPFFDTLNGYEKLMVRFPVLVPICMALLLPLAIVFGLFAGVAGSVAAWAEEAGDLWRMTQDERWKR